MDRKDYTLFIISPTGRGAKRLPLSPFLLRFLGAFLAMFFVISCWVLHDYLTQVKQSIEIDELLTMARSQMNEIQFFRQKVRLMEDEIHKLQNAEAQIQNDWQEIGELSKKTKMTPVNMIRKGAISDPEERISVREESRPEFICRLHHDLIDLRHRTLSSSKQLDELKETLYLQKTTLMATPSLWPVPGRITSPFGETRIFVASGGTKPHKGIDIAAPIGTPIVAPAAGVVIAHDSQPDYGNMIFIDHGHGFASKYGHLQKIYAKTGKKVKKGEVIGTVGMTGFSNGPHLHYEIHFLGSTVNPYGYLTEVPAAEN